MIDMRRRMPNRRMRRSAKKITRDVALESKGKKKEKDILLMTVTFKGLYPNHGYLGDFKAMRRRITKALEGIHFHHVGVTSISQKKVGKLKVKPKPKKSKVVVAKIKK